MKINELITDDAFKNNYTATFDREGNESGIPNSYHSVTMVKTNILGYLVVGEGPCYQMLRKHMIPM